MADLDKSDESFKEEDQFYAELSRFVKLSIFNLYSFEGTEKS